MQRVHLLTLLSQLVPACALASLVGWPLAAALTSGVWLVVSNRLQLLVNDRQRPRWVVVWVDEPVFVHWGACAYGLLLFILAFGMLALATWLGVTWPVAKLGGWSQSVSVCASGAYLLGVSLAAYSVWGTRRRLRVRTVEVTLARLPLEFAGYRIVHLSDLHIGSFDPEERGRQWVNHANSLNADLCVITGDFVTSTGTYYAAAAAVAGGLRAHDGVLACLGNHDQWDSAELVRLLREQGIEVLRNQWRSVHRGGTRIIIAGLDDRYTECDDLDTALRDRPAGVPTVLLAHDPAVSQAAAQRGVDLVLSGHTHGGQLGLPGLSDQINLTTVMRQPRSGLQVRNGHYLHISAGLGCTGPPLRLGVTPEIALLLLRPA